MPEEIITAQPETAIAETNRELTHSALAFDTTTRDGKVKLFNALNSADSLNDSHVTQLAIEGILVQSGSRVDAATGEVSPCEFTTFITADGAYFSQSDGIARSAKNLIAAFGDTFADEPITIQFVTKQLQGGRTLKQFVLV